MRILLLDGSVRGYRPVVALLATALSMSVQQTEFLFFILENKLEKKTSDAPRIIGDQR